MIVIRVKDDRNKWNYIIAHYRQWKAIGDPKSNSKVGIQMQVTRLKSFISQCEAILAFKEPTFIGGDLNLDHMAENDPLARPELAALFPHWDKFISDNELVQMNYKPTRHCRGQKSSLLDLIFTNRPLLCENISNIPNLTSEHENLQLDIRVKPKIIRPQFLTIRNYQDLNYNNIMPLIDQDIDL